MRDRIIIAILLGFVVLNFCLFFSLGMVTAALQWIGILPTSTPAPPLEVENQTQGAVPNLIPENASLLSYSRNSL